MAVVSLHDHSGLSLTHERIQLHRILEVAELPHGRVAIVLHHGQVSFKTMGICVGNSFARWYQGDIEFDDLSPGWNCGIALSRKTCEFFDHRPAFFTYVLGHELGHAITYLLDPATFVLGNLIREHIGKVSEKPVLEHELPHEAACDEFGVMITDQLFSRGQLVREIDSRLNDYGCNDPNRLRFLRSLVGSRRVKNVKNELVHFALPYREVLISSWKQKASDEPGSIEAVCIRDYDACFRLPDT